MQSSRSRTARSMAEQCSRRIERRYIPDFHGVCWLSLAVVWRGFRSRLLGPGYDGGPAVGPDGGGSRAPGGPFLLGGEGSCWLDWVRDGPDALPSGDDL
jgi:hypothetical protein